MPESSFPMTLPEGAVLIAEPCVGKLELQRAALKALWGRQGWPEWQLLPNGKPVLTAHDQHCSLSHGGGWVAAAMAPHPIGIDVEAPGERLAGARRRFAGPADAPVLDLFGDNLDTLCRLWTAKEAAFKVFGTGLDFLTGLEWRDIHNESANVWAPVQSQCLRITWCRLFEPDAWLAVATTAPDPSI